MSWLKGRDRLSRRAFRRIYGLVLALVALVGVLGVLAGEELRRNGREIDSSYAGQQALDELQVQFDRVVINVRGYIAYGHTDFLQDVQSVRVRFENRLEIVTAHGVPIAELVGMWKEYGELIDEAVRLKADGETDGLLELSRERTTPLIDWMNRSIDELVSEKERELDLLLKENLRVSTLLIWGILGIAVLVFGRCPRWGIRSKRWAEAGTRVFRTTTGTTRSGRSTADST